MNPILEKWLNEQKALENDMADAIQQEEKYKREAHLRSLGLIDESRIEKEILAGNEYGAKWDDEQEVFYKESHPVIEVSDEEYKLICKYAAPKEDVKDNSDEGLDLSAEKTLNGFAVVCLVLGIICAVIFTIAAITESGIAGWVSFGVGIGVLLIELLTWATVKVFTDISKTLKQIRKEK